MKNIDENNAFTKYFAALLYIVVLVCVAIIVHDIRTSKRQAPAQTHQVSEQQQEEVKLETLEDSVHYYEDGL